MIKEFLRKKNTLPPTTKTNPSLPLILTFLAKLFCPFLETRELVHSNGAAGLCERLDEVVEANVGHHELFRWYL